MNNITANALLKTLEEPVGDVRFVLASEAAWQLLPTIRSRCLGFTLPWPDDEARRRTGWWGRACPAADAAGLLRAAGGRPSDALAAGQPGQSPKAWSPAAQGHARAARSAPCPTMRRPRPSACCRSCATT